MRDTLIVFLAVLLVGLLAFLANADESCTSEKAGLDSAQAALDSAERTYQSKKAISDGALGSYILTPTPTDPQERALHEAATFDRQLKVALARIATADAKAARDAARAVRDYWRGNYDMCLASHLARYETGPCGHRYMHALALSHNIRFPFDCGHIDYVCSNLHVQVTCSDETYSYYGYDGDGVHHTYYATRSGCGRTYWYCKDSASHRASGSTSRVCLSSGGGSSSTRSSSGTTTSPPVQNNGGSSGGSSSDRVRCGHGRNGNACSRGGWASSREAHKVTCPAGHRYYACSSGGARFHANCRARRSGEVRCARGSLCRSGGYASSRNAHQTTCGRGHTYWSCWPRSVSYHRGH